MSKLNTQQIVENIYTLAKQRKIKIMDLEQAAGVSVGYLSKMNKPAARLPLDVVSSIAGDFGMTVDALINYDPTGATNQEKKIVKLFDKLIADTNADKLEWNVYLKDIYERSFTKHEIDLIEKKGLPPLAYSEEVDVKESKNGSSVKRYVIRHDSKFRNFNVEAKIYVSASNSFLADIGGGVQVFVAMTNYKYQDPDIPLVKYNFDGYEMYFIKNEQITKVCQATADEYPAYLSYFEKLQPAIKKYDARRKLDKDANNIIDSYLSTDVDN